MAVTPPVVAGYAKHLYSLDDKGQYATNKYKLEVFLPKGDEECEEFLRKLNKKIKEVGGKNNPIKDGDKYKGKSEKYAAMAKGHFTLTFKSKHKPKVVDAKKNVIPQRVAEVMGGDLVRIQFNAKDYDGLGGGVTLYLNGVQLLKKNSGFVDEFEEEDGFVVDDEIGVAEGDDDSDDADF